MLNYYQPYLVPFLGIRPYRVSENIKRFYYHSMEDAIWEFTRRKGILKGSLFLLPDFYCVDVLNNIENHGFNYKLWPVDKNFNTDIPEFIALIKKTKPKIIFVFHAAGITSNLMTDTRWLKYVSPDTVIIEDCVHRLINPEKIKLFDDRHVIMDSLRKDSPLPGSFVYGSATMLSYKQSTYRLSKYFLSTVFWYIIFRWVLMLGCLANSSKLTNFAHQKVLQIHDDIIGDSWESYRGLPWIPIIHRFINFKKVEKLKRRQVNLYKKLMKPVYQNSSKKNIFYEIIYPVSDYEKLHVYPVGVTVPESKTKSLISFLHKHNISVWIKFPKCKWNEDTACLFMPLGFHVSDKEIHYAVEKLHQFISSSS